MIIRRDTGCRLLLVVMTACVVLAGCTSLGPKTLDKDQLDYGHNIGTNWKNQMLSNIVKLRYVDMPVFVDVGSIVSGYSLETSVTGRVGFGDSFTGGDSQGLGASGKYTDRPTITYMPKTGDDYLRSLLEPVEPRNVLALIQAGYSAQLLFTWTVEAINGVHNYSATSARMGDADPEFLELTRLMQDLQNAGAVGFEFDNDPVTEHDIILVLHKEGLPDSIQQKRLRVAEIIGLDRALDRYRVIYAPFRIDGGTLAVQTRSIIQMLAAMAGFVEVPAGKASYAMPGYDLRSGSALPFYVMSGPDKPDSSFAAVRYEDYWYWIENSDIASKRVFTLMLFLTTLTNRASSDRGPVLTIPTG